MSKEQFPLIKRCFPELQIEKSLFNIGSDLHTMAAISAQLSSVKAYVLEQELKKAVRVYLLENQQINCPPENKWFAHSYQSPSDTHTGLLIGIEPIQKDTKQDEIAKRIAEINKLSREIQVLLEKDKS